MTLREGRGLARHTVTAMLFLACAVVFGGGGSPNPATEIILQLAFVACALGWLWLPTPDGRILMPRSRRFWWICALVLALPLLQLVPLPPAIWTALSGNEDRAAALALVGRENRWQPLTHSPARTLASLLAIVPALFAFFTSAALDAKGRRALAATIAALVLAAALLGAVQVSMGPDGPYLYAQNNRTLTGFQANRNAAADVFLIGMAAGAAFAAPWLAGGVERNGRRPGLLADRRAAAVALAGFVVLLLFATLFTASRTGIALLPLVLIGVCAIVWPALREFGRWRWVPPFAALAAVPAIALAALPGGNTALGTVAERFVFADDARRELWRDAWFAVQHNWPLGVGVGGAQPALLAAERLEVLQPLVPNRVHNDYVELALEGGLPGLLLLVAIAGILAYSLWRSWRDRPDERSLTSFGAVAILIVALHSFVDYPLRSMALACLVGTGAGLLIGTPLRLAHNEPSA